MTWNVATFWFGVPPSGGSSRGGLARTRSARGFTLIELIVVMTIIVVLATISVPAIRSVSKSNDESQATNLVRSIIGSARSIAIAQHRMAGVVFFEESSTYSLPANTNQTAMQLFVEDFNQAQWSPVSGMTVFIKYTSTRQYLPSGMKIASLTDASAGSIIETGDAFSTGANGRARAILFDSNGQIITRGGLATPNPAAPPASGAGNYPQAYGDWQFIPANVALPPITNASSYPGFFIYRKDEYDNAAGIKAAWLIHHSSVILVNPNTGTVLVDRGPGQ